MALSDCYVLRDVQSYAGEKVLNVYTFQDTTTVSTAEQLVGAFVDQLLPLIQAVQGSTFQHDLVDAVNMADPSNFFENAVAVNGGVTGELLPAFNAINFTLRLNSRALRPGSKRIAGLTENAQEAGDILDSGILADIELLRIGLKTVLTLSSVPTFHPVVIKRVLYDVPGSSPTRQAYRFPIPGDSFVFGDVIECLTTPHISHQVSRGNGR